MSALIALTHSRPEDLVSCLIVDDQDNVLTIVSRLGHRALVAGGLFFQHTTAHHTPIVGHEVGVRLVVAHQDEWDGSITGQGAHLLDHLPA